MLKKNQGILYEEVKEYLFNVKFKKEIKKSVNYKENQKKPIEYPYFISSLKNDREHWSLEKKL